MYSPPFFLRNKHVHTIYPSLFRSVEATPTFSDTIPTSDGDVLEFDFYKASSNALAILSHGLEGNTKRAYMLGMANALASQSINVLAWNFRGCGSKLNQKPRLYHSGATEDLNDVLDYALNRFSPSAVFLLGFSLGGNLTLKFLAEPWAAKTHVTAAAAISAPIDLSACVTELDKFKNIIYLRRFMRNLSAKARAKHAQFPRMFDIEKLRTITSLRQFDNEFTAPIHGFKNAEDYYAKSSSKNMLPRIQTKTFFLSALDDPFLSAPCFPVDNQNPYITTELVPRGGHVGFIMKDGTVYSEKRCAEFFKSEII